MVFAKCSNILKDPYNLKYSNKLKNYINMRNFENYFLDFAAYRFPVQAKQIFDELGYALKQGNSGIVHRSLNENVYFAFRDEKNDKIVKQDFLYNYFNTETFGWKIVQARTLYLGDITEDLGRNYAQITMTYSTKDLKDNYIVFERNLAKNLSFYSWKIFVINYKKFN